MRFFVLDEADEMLNMGFQEDVEQVLETVPQCRQTMMFSATMPQWVRKLARKYANNHIMVDLVGEHDTGNSPNLLHAPAPRLRAPSSHTVALFMFQCHECYGMSIAPVFHLHR